MIINKRKYTQVIKRSFVSHLFKKKILFDKYYLPTKVPRIIMNHGSFSRWPKQRTRFRGLKIINLNYGPQNDEVKTMHS